MVVRCPHRPVMLSASPVHARSVPHTSRTVTCFDELALPARDDIGVSSSHRAPMIRPASFVRGRAPGELASSEHE